LLSWPSTQATLNEEATGYTADGANQTAQYEGPGLTLGTFRGRWVDLRGEYEPHGGSLTVQSLIDGVAMPSQTITIGAGLAAYGTAKYGTGTYAGSGRRQFYAPLPLNADGRTYVLKLAYAGKEKFKLFNYHPGLVPESQVRRFSE
jgi:hypothetical protein